MSSWDARRLVKSGARPVRGHGTSLVVVLGFIMSVPAVPGPGIITIVIGLMLLDFAEKRRWARWVISRARILRAVNGLRRKYGKPPLNMRTATTGEAE